LKQLFIGLVDVFVNSESINHEVLAQLAMQTILHLPEETLLNLRRQYPSQAD
jgi:hypothetical protein